MMKTLVTNLGNRQGEEKKGFRAKVEAKRAAQRGTPRVRALCLSGSRSSGRTVEQIRLEKIQTSSWCSLSVFRGTKNLDLGSEKEAYIYKV